MSETDVINGAVKGVNLKEARREAATNAHLDQLVAEKNSLDSAKYPTATRLLDEELQRTKDTGRASFDNRYADIWYEKPIKIVSRVLVPIDAAPNFNFVGKLLGVRGSNLQRIQEDTRCKFAIYGRGSMKDKEKEAQLRASNDPKFAHLADELHVEVVCLAPPAEAHGRMSYALKELKILMQPDNEPDMDFEYMEPVMGPMPGGRRPPPPHSRPPPHGRPIHSSAKAMSFLEKARLSLDGGRYPQRGFEGEGRPMAPRFDDDPHGQWVSGGGYKPIPPGRRMFPPRSGPYGRP